jgi:hypothetical protein
MVLVKRLIADVRLFIELADLGLGLKLNLIPYVLSSDAFLF